MSESAASRAFGSATPGEHLAAIVESSDDAILSKDRDGVITTWNRAAVRMYGYTPEEAIGRPISILIPEHRAGEERQILDTVLKGGHVDHYDTERVTKDGRVIMVSLSVSPIRDESGEVVAASVIARDITKRHRTLALASMLQDLTSALSREATPDRVAAVALSHIVGSLGAPAGSLALVEDDDVVIARSLGHSAAGFAEWSRFPVAADVPMSEAIRSAEPIWIAGADELRERYPALREGKIRFDGLAVLPLVAGGAPLGAISLSFDGSLDFGAEERAFLIAAAQQGASALGRARMYEAERAAGERQRLLGRAGELLSQSLDPDAAFRQLAALAVGHIADWCGVEVLEEGGGLRSVAVAHADQERVRLAERLRERYPPDPDAGTGVPNVIRTGMSEVYPEITDQMLVQGAHDEEHLRLLRELGLGSAMVVPLKARGRVLGAITFVAAAGDRPYDEDDLSLAEDLARRAALAADNAMLFRREHEAAVILQRSLLPDSLPTRAGMAFDARYRPAGPGLEVGGDWYDAVVMDDGVVGLTIGDVAGRGIRAASVMGRIRPAMRAYVLDGHGPAEAMARLDRLVRESEPPEMTTVFHLQFEPDSGLARWVRAGHPPALVRLPSGEVAELRGDGTPPLGIFDDVECKANQASVPAGSLVLLYTDGLIERRDSRLDQELERLKTSLADGPSDPAGCLDWLESEVMVDALPDDIAIVAMSTPA